MLHIYFQNSINCLEGSLQPRNFMWDAYLRCNTCWQNDKNALTIQPCCLRNTDSMCSSGSRLKFSEDYDKSIGIRYIVSVIQSCDLLCWLQHGLAFNYCRRQQESHGAVFGTLTRNSTPILGIVHDNGHFIWDSTGISIHIYLSNTVYSGDYCGYLCRFIYLQQK